MPSAPRKVIERIDSPRSASGIAGRCVSGIPCVPRKSQSCSGWKVRCTDEAWRFCAQATRPPASVSRTISACGEGGTSSRGPVAGVKRHRRPAASDNRSRPRARRHRPSRDRRHIRRANAISDSRARRQAIRRRLFRPGEVLRCPAGPGGRRAGSLERRQKGMETNGLPGAVEETGWRRLQIALTFLHPEM